MPKTTPAEASAEWASRLGASVTKIQKGVDRVNESPGVSAANAKDKWVAKMSNPETHAKWERKSRAVNLQDWKSVTKQKVATNLASGVSAATTKMTSRYTDMFPYMQSLEDRIAQMPNITLQNSIERATAWMQGMAQYGASK